MSSGRYVRSRIRRLAAGEPDTQASVPLLFRPSPKTDHRSWQPILKEAAGRLGVLPLAVLRILVQVGAFGTSPQDPYEIGRVAAVSERISDTLLARLVREFRDLVHDARDYGDFQMVAAGHTVIFEKLVAFDYFAPPTLAHGDAHVRLEHPETVTTSATIQFHADEIANSLRRAAAHHGVELDIDEIDRAMLIDKSLSLAVAEKLGMSLRTVRNLDVKSSRVAVDGKRYAQEHSNLELRVLRGEGHPCVDWATWVEANANIQFSDVWMDEGGDLSVKITLYLSIRPEIDA